MSSTINQDSILSGKVSTQEVPLSGKVSTQDVLLSGKVAIPETLIGPPGEPGAAGKDGTKWWTYAYPIGITAALEKIMSKSNLPDAAIGDYVLHTMSNAGIVFEITGETADGSSWVVKEKCTLRGNDGITPHIGENGNWYLGTTDTGKPSRGATGAAGKDGTKWWAYEGLVTNMLEKLLISKKYLPAAVIGDYVLVTRNDAGVVYTITGETESDDSWVVKMECILKGAAGSDGITPTIGANGNWYLGTTDTGKPSRGASGEKGEDGVRGLGWYQDIVDTLNPQIYMWTVGSLAPKWGEGDWLYDPDNGNVGLCTSRTDNEDGSGSASITYKGTLKGDAGTTPHIGANGNWYIGDTDTGVSAEGRGLPAVTAADAGKFLRVSSSGSWVAETVANANGGEF